MTSVADACETSLIRDKTVTDRFHFVTDFDTICQYKSKVYELLANIIPIFKIDSPIDVVT